MQQSSLIHSVGKLIVGVGLLSFLGVLAAAWPQNVRVVSALPGEPIAQEPHHHLVLGNAYVNVYEVEVGPRDATLMHDHNYDNFFVAFGDSELTNTVAGQPPAALNLSDLAVHFAREPYAHVIANKGKFAFRNITIELLQAQGEMKSFYTSLNDALNVAAPDGSGIRQNRILETDELRVLAVAVPSSTAWSTPYDGRGRLLVLLDKINDGSAPTDANSPFPAGMVRWLPAYSELRVPNESDQPLKLMILEFKGNPAQPSNSQS